MAAGLGTSAHAAEVPAAPAAPAAPTAEEIVVTAQFRSQNLQKTPISITAISGDMLTARSQSNVSQIAAQAPGLNLQPGNQSFGPSMAASIRGVGQFDFSPAVEPGVGMYVDDVYYPSLMGAMFDLLDLDRIEILRGPQGTLAGRNSIGGALKLYSRRPTGSNIGMVQAGYGSRNRLDLRASGDFGITDNLSARISGAAKRQQGYVDVYDFGCVNQQGSAINPTSGGIPATRPTGQCLTGRDGNVDYQAVRAQLRYHPGAALDILLSADYVSDNHSPAPTVLLTANNAAAGAVRGSYSGVALDSRFVCGPYCNYENGQMPADTANGIPYATTRPLGTSYEGYGFSGQGDVQISPSLKLTSITGYRYFHTVYAIDGDLTPLPANGANTDMRTRFFSQEVRLNGKALHDRLNYTLGGYYSDQNTVYANVQDLRTSGLQFASLGDTVPAKSFALFAQTSWEVLPHLTLNGGIRRTHEQKDYTFSRRFANGATGQPRVGSLDEQTGAYAETRYDYRANIQYEWSPRVMTYAQFSTGYKGGGINPRPFFPSQVQPFSSESLKAWEIGLKSELFDRRVRFNASAFFNQYSNIQLVLTSCPLFTPGGAAAPCAMTANAGDAEVKGFEIETTLRPVAHLSIDASLSYLDFQYKSIAAAAAAGANGVRLTDITPYTSPWKWSIGGQYEIELPGGSSLTPRFDVAYQSTFYTQPRNVPTSAVPAYTVMNGRVTWRNAARNLDVTAEVTNIANRYYLVNVFDQTTAGGFSSGQPARPREWALIVTKRF
ncbi:TonB-dependent receptor [Novosphingobium sp. FSY-8]|uniref:TonB-dependent receptor n=2 Tax=Novosphingobium ovatum TaxID=1908523 RepID=A0ABW9XFU2_9SPHN|nr:TonB-dependent receptor [Novosphingobium ovatum]